MDIYNKDYSETNPKATFYACLYQDFRLIAIDCGYTLAIHGSMVRDMDLVAVPWIEDCKPVLYLVEKLCEAAGATIYKNLPYKETKKPHNRTTYSLAILDDWCIDLSVVSPFT